MVYWSNLLNLCIISNKILINPSITFLTYVKNTLSDGGPVPLYKKPYFLLRFSILAL